MPVYRKKVDKGSRKPVKGHFGSSPEFVPAETGIVQKPALRAKRRKPALKAQP